MDGKPHAKTDDDLTDAMKELPSNKFSKQILKSVIGEARAN